MLGPYVDHTEDDNDRSKKEEASRKESKTPCHFQRARLRVAAVERPCNLHNGIQHHSVKFGQKYVSLPGHVDRVSMVSCDRVSTRVSINVPSCR